MVDSQCLDPRHTVSALDQAEGVQFAARRGELEMVRAAVGLMRLARDQLAVGERLRGVGLLGALDDGRRLHLR